MQKVKVYLCVSVGLEGVSEEYRAVAEQCDLEPALFCLPWPETAIPAIGTTVCMNTMPNGFDDFFVESHEYYYSDEEIRLEVYLEAKDDPNASQYSREVYLRCLAETGFVIFSSWKPLKDIMKECGFSIEP